MKFIVRSKKYGNKEVLIDDEDWERVKQYTWGIHKQNRSTFYIRTNVYKGKGKNRKHKTITLHRFLMHPPER
jgi:hypothetical protein